MIVFLLQKKKKKLPSTPQKNKLSGLHTFSFDIVAVRDKFNKKKKKSILNAKIFQNKKSKKNNLGCFFFLLIYLSVQNGSMKGLLLVLSVCTAGLRRRQLCGVAPSAVKREASPPQPLLLPPLQAGRAATKLIK